jgi:hypothetical protein
VFGTFRRSWRLGDYLIMPAMEVSSAEASTLAPALLMRSSVRAWLAGSDPWARRTLLEIYDYLRGGDLQYWNGEHVGVAAPSRVGARKCVRSRRVGGNQDRLEMASFNPSWRSCPPCRDCGGGAVGQAAAGAGYSCQPRSSVCTSR